MHAFVQQLHPALGIHNRSDFFIWIPAFIVAQFLSFFQEAPICINKPFAVQQWKKISSSLPIFSFNDAAALEAKRNLQHREAKRGMKVWCLHQKRKKKPIPNFLNFLVLLRMIPIWREVTRSFYSVSVIGWFTFNSTPISTLQQAYFLSSPSSGVLNISSHSC